MIKIAVDSFFIVNLFKIFEIFEIKKIAQNIHTFTFSMSRKAKKRIEKYVENL
jgi:hypothetical protein